MNKERLRICGLIAGLLILAPAFSAEFVVNSTADAIDIDPGDGVCATADAECTLRAAIMEANALPGADIVDLTAINDPASPILLTLEGVDENWVEAGPGAEQPCLAEILPEAAIGDLDITDDLEVFGAGPALTVIRWENQSIADPDVGDRVFHIQATGGKTINLVRIADVMIRDGSVGIPNSLDVDNVYNCGEPVGPPGEMSVWQFKRVGGGIAAGPGAAVFLFEEAEHGPGGGGGSDHGGPPDDPGGDEGEGGITAVELERVAMLNNQAGSDGGAIMIAAETSIVDSVFSGNLSGANGGAIYIDSATTIHGTLIGTTATDVPYESAPLASDLLAMPNVAENGGGIFDTGSHTTNIGSSAINGNEAIGGGGIAARSLIVINLTNSTVSGNTGKDVGGGITTNGTVNLRNSTIANNLATTDAPGGGAGLNAFGSGTYVFYNTVLSNNVVQGGEVAREANCGCSGGAAECPPGRMVTQGYNISDEVVDTCSLSLALSDRPATDPLLKPLANNGGLTETHALPTQLLEDPVTSPAVDGGDNLRCPNNDQRGSLRPDDGDGDGSYDCDVGAFEVFILRADLHINNVVAPDEVDKGTAFPVVVEIHNDDAVVAAPGVEFTATLDTLVNASILAAVPSTGSCGVPAHTVTCTLGDMAIGAVETIQLTLVGDVQGSYSLASVVQAAPGTVDPVPGNNSVVTSFFVLGNADIGMMADPVPAVVDQGDTITFGYTVINNGEDNATGARLGMIVPNSASFVSASTTIGNCAEGAGEVVCNIGALGLGESAVIQINLSADDAGETEYSAVAVADQNDPDASNNSASATVMAIANADLELTATGPGSLTVGGEFDVTLTATNNGPQDASNVVITASVPALFELVSAVDCALADGTLECVTANLAADESTSFVLRFSAGSTGTAAVEASVVADENDPDAANNVILVSVTVNAAPTPPPAGGGGGGGGGCVHNPASPADPTLPLILFTLLMALGVRHRMHV